MNAFINHFSFEFRTGIRNKTLLLMNYLLPMGFYAMLGLLMTGINPAFRETMMPAFSILVIPVLTTIWHTAVVTIIIATTAPLFFDAPLPVNWLGFIVTFFLMAFACAGLSVLIAVVSSSSRMTVLWSQLIFLPSMILGGMMVPYSMLPEAMGKIAQLLPATHAMNAFRGLAQDLTADFNPIR